MSEPTDRSPLPLAYGVLALVLLLAPCAYVNHTVEPPTGDRPVRIARWVEHLETVAQLGMIGTIALVVFLSKRRRQPVTRIGGMAIAQGAAVFFLALPLTYLTRGGSLLEGGHVKSYSGPNGRSAHVYERGSGGCGYLVYLAEGWNVSMRRVISHSAYSSNKPAPDLRWNEDGTVTLMDPTKGGPLESRWCKGLLD